MQFHLDPNFHSCTDAKKIGSLNIIETANSLTFLSLDLTKEKDADLEKYFPSLQKKLVSRFEYSSIFLRWARAVFNLLFFVKLYTF